MYRKHTTIGFRFLVLAVLAVVILKQPKFGTQVSDSVPAEPKVVTQTPVKVRAPQKVPQKVTLPAAKKPAAPRFTKSTDFIKAVTPFAESVGKEYNIDPKILITHAAHETNWGKSIPRHKDGRSSHNLFGIKASKSHSSKINVKTHEHRKGVKKVEYANFRSYSNFGESFRDYIKLMHRTRFDKVLGLGHNPKAYFSHLQKAGYATDPRYAEKLIGAYKVLGKFL